MANTIEDIWVQDGWFTIAGRYRGFKLEDKKTIRGYFEFLKKLKNENI